MAIFDSACGYCSERTLGGSWRQRQQRREFAGFSIIDIWGASEHVFHPDIRNGLSGEEPEDISISGIDQSKGYMILRVDCQSKLEAHCDFIGRSVDGALSNTAVGQVADWAVDLQIPRLYLVVVIESSAIVNWDLMVVGAWLSGEGVVRSEDEFEGSVVSERSIGGFQIISLMGVPEVRESSAGIRSRIVAERESVWGQTVDNKEAMNVVIDGI